MFDPRGLYTRSILSVHSNSVPFIFYGSGFLVSSNLAFTATHVVERALGINPNTCPKPPEDAEIKIKFPLCDDSDSFYQAKVLFWETPNSHTRMADIALLQLTKPIPASALPGLLNLSYEEGTAIGNYRAGSHLGASSWVYGLVGPSGEKGRRHVIGTNSVLRFLAPGFSGSAAYVRTFIEKDGQQYLTTTNQIVGMAVTRDPDTTKHEAWIIPSIELNRFLTEKTRSNIDSSPNVNISLPPPTQINGRAWLWIDSHIDSAIHNIIPSEFIEISGELLGGLKTLISKPDNSVTNKKLVLVTERLDQLPNDPIFTLQKRLDKLSSSYNYGIWVIETEPLKLRKYDTQFGLERETKLDTNMELRTILISILRSI